MRQVNSLFLIAALVGLFCHSALSAQELVVSKNTVQRTDLIGDVLVRNGASLSVFDATISGNVIVEQGGSFIGTGARIEGQLMVLDGQAVTLRNSARRPTELSGDLRLDRIRGVIRILDAKIGGRILIENSPAAEIVVRGNSIDQDLQLFANEVDGPFLIRNNTIQGTLQLGWSRDVPQMSGNLIAGGIPSGSEVAIYARGISGTESVALQIDQQTVSQWQLTPHFACLRFRSNEFLLPDRIRVASILNSGEIDDLTNGLVVDWLEIDGTYHESEHHTVYANGVARSGTPAPPGFHQTETLAFEGYFQFGIDGIQDDVLLAELNSALPDGWSFSLYEEQSRIYLRTFDPKRKKMFTARFGAAGIISNLEDARSRKLIAPPFSNENTDRVLQWTMWETGPLVVHDIPSLPWYEDRFNITQAGTSENTYQATVEVSMLPTRGQLDVWAVHDRQWKSELEPFVSGSLTSLTRINALDGGAILVRRVIRIGEVTKYGLPVALSEPLIEAWSPFADSAFDAIALDLNSKGKPSWWYADSKNIPYYPHWPVDTTRGWTIAYKRSKIRSGPTVAVVFEQDPGTVTLAEGSTIAPQGYYLNTMDFNGGIAVLPGFFPGSLSEGAIVDLHLIFFPGSGIKETTAAMLDELANRLPPPCAYQAGAPMSGELSVIADRLSTLQDEPQIRTDKLGEVR